MIRLGEAMTILELHRQGLSVTAIARRTGRDPKTIRKYIERGVELPAYGPRQLGRPCKIAPYMEFLRERVIAFPELTASQLTREIREMGYTAVKAIPRSDPTRARSQALRGPLRDQGRRAGTDLPPESSLILM